MGRQAAAGRSSTGSFTSAHADGCAEQCFEGVQFGSLFNVLKFFANSLPVCFPTLIWFALSEQGRSWRICRAARFNTVRTCLPYEVFKVQYGAVDQPGKALFFKGSFLADVHKTHGSGAERGMRRRLWAWSCGFHKFKLEDLRNQLDFKRLTQFIINAQVRHTVFVIEASGGQRRDVRFIMLQDSVDCVNIAACCRFDHRERQQRVFAILRFVHLP